MKLSTYKKLTVVAFIVFSVIYLLLTLLIPPDQAAISKYHITSGQAVALALTIVVPYVVIWFIALAGYLGLRSYVDAIRGSKDGEALATISRGVFLLALWLPLSAITGGIVTYVRQKYPAATDTIVILNNYLNLVILFASFWIVYKGSRQLLALIKTRYTFPWQPALTLAYIVFAACYVFLVFHDPARQFPTSSTVLATYYQPDWLILTTLVIPRLIMWFLGILAVYYIYLYSKNTKGILYKKALRSLALGLGWVVVATIVLRCFQSLAVQVARLNLAAVLIVIYLLLVLISVGYVLINRGSNDLKKIEGL